jgi:hypothetical protein
MKKVHLIRTSEVDQEVYASIVQYLQQFKGPLEFYHYDESFQLKAKAIKVIKKTDDDFEIMKEVPSPMLYNADLSLSAYRLDPPEVKAYEWIDFFKVADRFRELHQIHPEDHVFVLTYKGNRQNWFVGSASKGIKNYFIHLVYWEHFILSEPTFPVAYHVASTVLKNEVWRSLENYLPHTHDQPRGCMSDMCWDKKEIVLKLRTADFCRDCWSSIMESEVDRSLVQQVLRIFDSVRTQLMFRERFIRMGTSIDLIIHCQALSLIFPSLGNLKVKLTPLEFSVYLFFLESPQGILLSHLSDYKMRLMEIYRDCSGETDVSSIEYRVGELVNPLSNSISEKLSKIKSKLINLLGTEMAQTFIILGPNGGLKKISTPRDLVSFQ